MTLNRLSCMTAAALAAMALATLQARADEAWQPFNPFNEVERRNAEKLKRDRHTEPVSGDERPALRPMNSPDDRLPDARSPETAAPAAAPDAVMREALPPPVEKGELAPVMAADGSGLPFELWRGLDAAGIEALIKDLEIPPRSPALHNLWTRLITSSVTPASGETSNANFSALRLEALYRSGLAKDAALELAKEPVTSDPLIAVLAARNELASGNADKACEIARQPAGLKGAMPPRLKSQAILMSGYCAVLANDTASAGLAAELAREEDQDPSPGLDALDAISIGSKVKIASPKTISLLDYRLVERAGGITPKDAIDKGEPALLVALANDASTPAELRLAAGEAAARLNALAPETLAGLYRSLGKVEAADAVLTGGSASSADRRAALFKATEAEQSPLIKTHLMRALLDDAKRQGLMFQTLRMLAPVTAALVPAPEFSWFAETAAEIGLAAGQLDLARRWITGAQLTHWLALIDIADPNLQSRGESLAALEPLAVSGRFSPDGLHRLATVLDALAYNVPIPLWDAASRTPQPNTGYLPPTGVLSELQDAAKKKEFGRTVLLAMRALGPNGAEGAHMIALGDSIRALKRAGLEAEARRLGLEALLGSWPHSASRPAANATANSTANSAAK